MAQVAPLEEEETPPTFLPPPLSPSSPLQRALGEWREQSALGFWRVASGSGGSGAGDGDVPARHERPAAGVGASLYLSCGCLMYTHPLYLLPNKRNTSVLPTETALALALQTPRAQRRSQALRAAEPGTVGTGAPSRPVEVRAVHGGGLGGLC